MHRSWWYVLLGVLALLAVAVVLRCDSPNKPRSVTLTWQAPAQGGGVTVVGYNVYRRTLDSDSFVKIAEKVPGPLYDDRLVTRGRTYIYVVTAVDATGRESRFSPETTAKVPSINLLF
jgi:fibronectin type 3 domain-containing protein